MSKIRFPEGFRLERLIRAHPRSKFRCGEDAVDRWLSARALQNQNKRLSVTKALLAPTGSIAGYYTLAMGQVDFSDIPAELAKGLPRRALPVAILAWLGVSVDFKGQGLGQRLVASALSDMHQASQTFPFIAVILDCLNDRAKEFYRQWEFRELPGHPVIPCGCSSAHVVYPQSLKGRNISEKLARRDGRTNSGSVG